MIHQIDWSKIYPGSWSDEVAQWSEHDRDLATLAVNAFWNLQKRLVAEGRTEPFVKVPVIGEGLSESMWYCDRSVQKYAYDVATSAILIANTGAVGFPFGNVLVLPSEKGACIHYLSKQQQIQVNGGVYYKVGAEVDQLDASFRKRIPATFYIPEGTGNLRLTQHFEGGWALLQTQNEAKYGWKSGDQLPPTNQFTFARIHI